MTSSVLTNGNKSIIEQPVFGTLLWATREMKPFLH